MTAEIFPPPTGLAQRLRQATRALHTQVERAGVMHHLLRGQLSRAGYCALLRNLHALYSGLEAEIQRAGTRHAVLLELVPPVLLRTPALEQDLLHLHGPAWSQQLPVTQAALAYVQRLQTLGQHQPLLLAAHAYVRYLGDLNGGQMLAALVARHLHLPAGQGVAFYNFGADAPLAELKLAFSRNLARTVGESGGFAAGDGAAHTAQPVSTVNAEDLVQEACSAFERHRLLFEELESPPRVAEPAA